MKKILIGIVAIFFSHPGIGQVKKFQDLIGHWDIATEDAGASLEFIDSSTIYLTFMGEKKKIIKYSIDYSKSPSWFDFTVQDSTSVIHVTSLVQLFGDNTMKWQIFLDEERSPYFTASRGEILYLKKSKPVGPIIAKLQ